MKFLNGKLVLTDLHKGSSIDEIKKNTGCKFEISDNLNTFE